MKRIAKVVITSFAPLVTPFLALAQVPGQVNTIITNLRDTFNLAVIALIVLATLVFIWGVIKYILSADDEKGRAAAKQIMLWGIIALAAIIAVWGIVQLLVVYFGVGGEPIPPGIGAIP